ncbi:MOSC domain-containing protein [Argonema antarcticum]|uniref:MOSC domain-containing protein n=1 Tax=Argonema antarcticum TaxID=2942763 RepID=UPI002012815C|nr:MOSC domain-containing protein [Argonema antarcticum]MCL1473387.1 MOSC domain-containing protein [Argonema antarcticum A004/B2]
MVTDLLIKIQKGKPLLPVEQLEFDTNGITGNLQCLPLRQVLIIPQATLKQFDLKVGDLRENVVVDNDGLHELASGVVLRIGEALIRLTFHCEPCKVIRDKVNLQKIPHQRGVLGSFLNKGRMRIGDAVSREKKLFDPIPYELADRVMWYLDKQEKPVDSLQLLHDIGLSKSYARVLPTLLKKLPKAYTDLVVFRSKQVNSMKLILDYPL